MGKSLGGGFGGGSKTFGMQMPFDVADPLGIYPKNSGAANEVRRWGLGTGGMDNLAKEVGVEPLYSPPDHIPTEEELAKQSAEKEQKARSDADVARAAQLAGVQGEYDKRYANLATQRQGDISSFSSRMKEWGFDTQSGAFSTGVQSITSTYDQKLSDLGADPYFSEVRKQTGWT